MFFFKPNFGWYVRQWCPSQLSNSRIVFSVWKSRTMQDETRHCEMMQDGVPSFVKVVFCWCVQPSVCRSLRQWFFAMSNSWVVFSVWKSENKCFAVDCATLQRQIEQCLWGKIAVRIRLESEEKLRLWVELLVRSTAIDWSEFNRNWLGWIAGAFSVSVCEEKLRSEFDWSQRKNCVRIRLQPQLRTNQMLCSVCEEKLRLWVVNRNPYTRNGRWTSSACKSVCV